MFLSANLHAHSYTQRFPKGFKGKRSGKKEIDKTKDRGGKEGDNGCNRETKGGITFAAE